MDVPRRKRGGKRYVSTRNGLGGPRSYSKRTYDQRDIDLRKAVMTRDGYRCQFPGCGATKRLQVHHILRWADAPALRYSVYNCLCLCQPCHKRITGNENMYASMLREIVRRNSQ